MNWGSPGIWWQKKSAESELMAKVHDKIRVTVALHAGLKKYRDGKLESEVELKSGATVEDLIEELGMAEEDVWIIGVNGILAKRENLLDNGDRVEFYEPVAGG
jgi:sulfur carrier protein ThiS